MRLPTTRILKYRQAKTKIYRLAVSLGIVMLSLAFFAPNALAKAVAQPTESGKFDPIQLVAILPVVLFVAYLLFRPRKKPDREEIRKIEGSQTKKRED